MRRLVGALRSPGGEPVVEQPAGSAGLHELVRECNAAGLPARLRLHDVAPDDLPPAVAASVHRIVQESLTNVRRHGVDVTTVDVEVVRRGGRVEIVVRDDGCGMTAEALANAFEPFYSSGKPGAGLGLGLAISHAIARRHGGTLEASSPGPGRGSRLVLRLPAVTECAP